MTQRDFYTKVIATTENAEVKAFAENAIVKLDERNAKRKTTKSPNQKQNEEFKKQIVDYITENGQKSAAEIAEGCELSSTSKASALLRQLTEIGAVEAVEVRVKGKGKHKEYFIPTEE